MKTQTQKLLKGSTTQWGLFELNLVSHFTLLISRSFESNFINGLYLQILIDILEMCLIRPTKIIKILKKLYKLISALLNIMLK